MSEVYHLRKILLLCVVLPFYGVAIPTSFLVNSEKHQLIMIYHDLSAFFGLLLVKSGFMMLYNTLHHIGVDIPFSTLRVYHLISINDV